MPAVARCPSLPARALGASSARSVKGRRSSGAALSFRRSGAPSGLRPCASTSHPAMLCAPISQRSHRASRLLAVCPRAAVEADIKVTKERRIPVTVLTGFLGSGKTTTLNYLLNENHGKRLAIIENEYGEIDIDSKLVNFKDKTDEQIMMLNNGCLCCTVRGDLIEMIFKLYEERRDDFDHLVIETTGLANPAPIIKTFTDEDMRQLVQLDGVVTVVDAKNITRHMDAGDKERAPNEAIEQLAYADRVILNKTDLVDKSALSELEARIRNINSLASIKRATYGKVDVDYILGVGGYDLDKVQAAMTSPESVDHSDCDHDHGDCKHEHGHDHAHDHANCDHDHGHCEHEGHDHHHSHGLHNDKVNSVSMTLPGNLDLVMVNNWLGSLLSFRGNDLYRMKGILSIEGYDKKFVFHGVHEMFEGLPHSDWAEGEERMSQIVFIGRELDRELLQAGFEKCQAQPVAK